MRIKKVVIRNFRSIKSLEIHPQAICALVGQNDAGKTNILSALNFLLGETWPTRRGLEASDYHNEDTSQTIYIEVEFDANPQNIGRIWCTMPWDEQGETKVEYTGNSTAYHLSNKVREQCALVYLDANRNLDYHLGHSRWTLFGRITRQLDDDFRRNALGKQQQALEASFNQALASLRTNLYTKFEETFKAAFAEQIKLTNHKIEIDFRTFDPLNYYRSIQPLLVENGVSPKTPSEIGQGMRNLILLALFRTYAKVFKDNAIIGIEEPEIYLHPHAQRSLAALFRSLAAQGGQIFFSTHSGNFVDVEHFDEVCIVEKLPDNSGDLCTQVQQVSVKQLLGIRQGLHPSIKITEQGMRERYHNICNLEHNEAFFARKIVLVEGASEEYALPVFAQALGYDLNANGVSIVNANGKDNLDQLYQLYKAFGIPVYLIFDNDKGGKTKDLDANETLLRMLGLAQIREPDATSNDSYAILEGDFEKSLRAYLDSIQTGKYEELQSEATEALGTAGKPLRARFIAERLKRDGLIPRFIKEILEAVRSLAETSTETKEENPDSLKIGEDDIPF